MLQVKAGIPHLPDVSGKGEVAGEHRGYGRPLRIRQVTRIPPSVIFVLLAIFGCPHADLPSREINSRQENSVKQALRGSIRDNIAASRPGASPAEVIAAARLAGADEFIERLPQGLNTPLEEGASNLSGGQRQRLAIARALLPSPRFLILYEATSALDPESECIVMNNLGRIAAGRTVIIISHRLTTLVPCDAICVMERGRIIDIGAHDDLLRRCHTYGHLWSQQNRHIRN
jgi:ABC-type transport system involved in cytochrome bd biosynthesis fused ATPase/permease subunit